MSVIIFILILGALIFVHELGHFLVAKKNGIRVDEFAIGFPPKLFSFKRGGTRYALNLIPFGGYVKIFGENPDEVSSDPDAKDSFVNKNRFVQASVIVAGVCFNFLFAWLLFSISFMTGFPSTVTEENRSYIQDVNVVVTGVLPESPAETSGLMSGDKIAKISSNTSSIDGEISIQDVQDFIGNNGNSELVFSINRGGEEKTINVLPQDGIVEGKTAVGITMDLIGIKQLPIHKAIWDGLKTSITLVKDIAVGLALFISQAVTGQADLNQVSGPVGIVELVGNASEFGFVYLLGFTAFISLNLAVLNLVPFPALDGGRLLFIIIEGVTRKKIKPSVANALNLTGFLILIIFMIVITVSDVSKLF